MKSVEEHTKQEKSVKAFKKFLKEKQRMLPVHVR